MLGAFLAVGTHKTHVDPTCLRDYITKERRDLTQGLRYEIGATIIGEWDNGRSIFARC